MQNFCSKCGTKLTEDQNFCPKCGTKVQSDLKQPDEEVKKESVVEKKTLNTQSYPSQNKSIDPKIKKISILIVGLFLSLLISGLIFNFPINSSLRFDINDIDDVNKYIELRQSAYNLAKEEGDTYNANQLGQISAIQTLERISALQNKAYYYFPISHFTDSINISLLILLMIIITLASNELIKNKSLVKWVIILGIIVVGVVFAYSAVQEQSSFFGTSIGTGMIEETLIFYICISGSIVFSMLAFYNINKIIYWIAVSSAVSLFLAIGFFDYDHLVGLYARSALTTPLFYLLRYLNLASFIILPGLAYYFFLKEFVYKMQPEESL